jgi:hypothetical protein
MSETAEAVMKSATAHGGEQGLTGEQMNLALNLAGLQDGTPGAWWATEKGARYVAEQYRQRGTGGYSIYNKSWDWLTWDPAVLDELDLSETAKRGYRQAVKDRRRAMQALRAAEIARREAAAMRPAASDNSAAAVRPVDPETLAKVLLGAAVAYGLYKAVPLVRRRWKERAGAPEQTRDRSDREA